MKAVGLFSGGLDSALAIKLMQEQGVEVIALNFVSPFCTCTGGCSIVGLAKKLGVKIILMNKGADYLRLVRHPRFGYGKNLNPCIDCKIYIFKKAKEYAKKIGAKFLFSGEVLGQRPMSQHFKTLMLIEKKAGLKGKLVRPLSAALMPPTEAEKKGWINRDKLLDIEGRRRVLQIDLAKKFRIDGFMCGGSGCRLTNKEYASKLRDLFKNSKRVSLNDVRLLNFGRHFRFNKNRIIVGRNEYDNKNILLLKQKSELAFDVKDCNSPISIIRGKTSREVIRITAALTARYSDAKERNVIVKYGKDSLNKEILVKKLTQKEIDDLRI